MNNYLLEWQNFTIEVKDKRLLDETSLLCEKGSLNLILGLNGCGKTVLLKNLAGFESKSGQDIFIRGRELSQYDVKGRAKLIAYLPQFPEYQEDMFVKEYFDLCRYAYDDSFAAYLEKKSSQEYYEWLNLDKLMMKKMGYLSGGELKKVAFMGCLVQEPELLLLDEPFQHLDPHYKSLFFKIIKKLRNDGVTVVMASHDFQWCLPLADKILGFLDLKLAEGSGSQFMTKVFSYPFTGENYPYPQMPKDNS
jgi:iron complex transport system ATP-binding protein